MDCHEPHPAPNEEMQGIQWTERPTGALVAAGSLWPSCCYHAHSQSSSTGVWYVTLQKYFLHPRLVSYFFFSVEI